MTQDTAAAVLHTLALEIMDTLYPEPNWLRVVTIGAFLPDQPNAGVV